jgi:hypothetical protein
MLGVYLVMSRLVAVMLALSSVGLSAATPRYLATIQQRSDASDLVCTAVVSTPIPTGVVREIDGRDRDQLSAEASIEKCFKGEKPPTPTINVLGYSVYAAKDLHGTGFAYAGPPTGFVSKGRNLIFLRRTTAQHQFEIAVPVYETAIRLLDSRPYYPDDNSPAGILFALTREFEVALLQSGSRDIYYIQCLFDLLGNEETVHELRNLSPRAPLAIQRDIAVALLDNGQLDCEPIVISLLLDSSAPEWKRHNAAYALGDRGTQRALPYLRKIAAQSATNDDLKVLRNWTVDAIRRLECRIENSGCYARID